MSWTLKYTDANNVQQSIAFESLGALEGGLVTGTPVKFSFRSHGPSEAHVKIPNVDPATNPQIPYQSQIQLFDKNNVKQFEGRRVDLEGDASGTAKNFEYQFKDAWFDLANITFKSVWWSGAYIKVSVNGDTVTLPSGMIFFGNVPLANFYTYDPIAGTYTQVGAGWNVTPDNQVNYVTTTVTIAGGTGALNGTLYMAFYSYYTDAVLFQYRPGDPYQDPTKVVHYYISTGDQIREILSFAISTGVNLQIGQIDPNIFVPWYPVRCMKCSDAIKICLRMHPDCYTEIDYTTTPPTFNVRQRSNLTPVTMPYGGSDANGNMHVSSTIKPRPDLIPSRIGIFYRYLINGTTAAFPQDIYPPNAPDGLQAFDYTVDLQGPRLAISTGYVQSASFVPNTLAWWLQKHPELDSTNMPDVSAVQFADASGLTLSGQGNNQADLNQILVINDATGLAVDWVNTYQWEFIGGAEALGSTGINIISATVTGYFNYARKDSNNGSKTQPQVHPLTCRVRLVNTPSIFQTFAQYLTSGEAIPTGLAQSIYTSLQTLQYNVSHSVKSEPFTSFVKPGKHALNLSGGNAAWAVMNACCQTVEYSLYEDNLGNSFAMAQIRCGPVEHLEPGSLVQLFNIFANRDLTKIDPWERITGSAAINSAGSPITTTPRENSIPALPDLNFGQLLAPFTPR